MLWSTQRFSRLSGRDSTSDHPIADLGVVLLVVRLEAAGLTTYFPYSRVADAAIDLHDDRLLHLVAHDDADDRAALLKSVAVVVLSRGRRSGSRSGCFFGAAAFGSCCFRGFAFS